MIISKIVSKCKKRPDKSVDSGYAYFTAIELVNRLFLLGNLWVSTQVFAFAICFMNIVANAVLGIFFYNLFLSPILTHSPHFRTLYKTNKKTFIFVIIGTFFFGANWIRLLYSKIFGTITTANEFNAHYFFVKPLNNISNFTLAINFIQMILCIACLIIFTLGKDAWMIGLMGLMLNLLLAIF